VKLKETRKKTEWWKTKGWFRHQSLLCGRRQDVVSHIAVTCLRSERTDPLRLRTSPACTRETPPVCTNSSRCPPSWSTSNSSTSTSKELLRSTYTSFYFYGP